ncbi:DUF4389 domain-containing protein [Marinagarivorans cellulosilyticus]|uniref:Lipase n=1 Tax=Marinagarivorans cellulosilyticus TaxID=2721545 RepID=A0AAN2BLF1_9GAMM|nr:DUF4389 domain-containing protein [Marinagarivorans cellulosilyticus]BCD99078.1 hypothetical protein MARGE09_P3279 [Marinagarivorans cellulosilyticus]
MDPQLKKNLSSAEYWFRALYVVFFLVCAEIAGTLILLIALAQIIFTLITGHANARLVRFGASLAKYLFAIFNFATCKSEVKPFPFSDWPEVDAETPVEQAVVEDVEEDVVEDKPTAVVVEPEAPAAEADVQPETKATASQEPDVKDGKATQDA